MDKHAVDWTSPSTLAMIILTVLLGIAFLYGLWQLQGRFLP
ncbi:MAG: hypothetical protein AABX37_06035 [Nanoarchaeota archaeon]